MELTERDQRLFHWINGHGFVTVRQASAWMGANYQAAQRRMRKLVDAGFLERKRLLHGDKRVHWVTKQALAASGDNLAPPQTIGLGSYRHDLVLVDVAQSVVDHTGGDFVPERRLRRRPLVAGELSSRASRWRLRMQTGHDVWLASMVEPGRTVTYPRQPYQPPPETGARGRQSTALAAPEACLHIHVSRSVDIDRKLAS